MQIMEIIKIKYQKVLALVFTKDGSATGLKILQWLQPRVATL
jgi:hypothetical protein